MYQRPPAAHLDHPLSLTPLRNASPPHLSTAAKDSSPANANQWSTQSCTSSAFDDMMGRDGPNCETEWFDFACVGVDPMGVGRFRNYVFNLGNLKGDWIEPSLESHGVDEKCYRPG